MMDSRRRRRRRSFELAEELDFSVPIDRFEIEFVLDEFALDASIESPYEEEFEGVFIVWSS